MLFSHIVAIVAIVTNRLAEGNLMNLSRIPHGFQ